MTRRILVAGIGNIFLGDDGFGSEVARRLLTRSEREGVQVVDIGIQGIDLAYLLLEDFDALVLVDTVARGGAPGTIYLIEPETGGVTAEVGANAGRAGFEGHSMDPAKVLAFARALGARPIPTYLVACEAGLPAAAKEGGYDAGMRMGLSAPVAAAVEPAIDMVQRLVGRLVSAPEGART